MSSFAARLLHARSDAGLTQRELSEKTGISTVQLSRYESGKSTPRPPVLMKIAKTLGVGHDWLAKGGDRVDVASDAMPSSPSAEFAHRLARARKGLGWTQAELAELSGVTESEIASFEAGRSSARVDVIADIAKAMGIGFDWLRDGTGPVEIGATIPRYPESQKLAATFDFEKDPELWDAVQEIADMYGLTIEMSIKQALLDSVRYLRQKDAEAKQNAAGPLVGEQADTSKTSK